MLDKSLCIRCRRLRTWWNRHDEKRWERGVVICAIRKSDGGVEQVTSGTKLPPKHCLFALEHVVTEAPSKEKQRV